MDVNVRAFRVVQVALGNDDAKPVKAASQKGGRIGGPARAKAITRERRVEIARNASAARWHKQKSELQKKD